MYDLQENLGDPAACYAICMQRIEGQGAYLKANGYRLSCSLAIAALLCMLRRRPAIYYPYSP